MKAIHKTLLFFLLIATLNFAYSENTSSQLKVSVKTLREMAEDYYCEAAFQTEEILQLKEEPYDSPVVIDVLTEKCIELSRCHDYLFGDTPLDFARSPRNYETFIQDLQDFAIQRTTEETIRNEAMHCSSKDPRRS